MKFKLGTQWLDDRTAVTRLMHRVLDETGQANRYLFELGADVTLFREGEKLNNIYILIDGSVQLWKRKPYNEVDYPVIRLDEGALIGIIAFTTGMESLTSAKTLEPCRFFRIPKEDVDHLADLHPKLSGYLDELILANLLERFRQTIILQMKLDSANSKLQDERNELKQAYADLQKAQKQLVHQEKMATLGQLVAGFAHEVNNPTAALMRSIDNLESHLQRFMKEAITEQDPEWLSAGRLFFERGKKAGYSDTRTIRERTEIAAEHFPDEKKPRLRLIARMPDDLIEMLVRQSRAHPDHLHYFLDQFEFGMMFQNIESSGERISGLVRSLKSYSRSDSEERIEEIDIREGIHDTLQLTSNRIKFYDLYLDLPEIPMIRADAAGLNQVWTNIILNAADVMGKQGSLDIRCGFNSDEKIIWVTIQDSGPGIPEENLTKIFEPSFTTKQTGVKFGLGLGLSISKDIVENHNGTIIAENARDGGARFTVTLPV
ncbi:MAG: cyclic nucleotide-binding domain-containing protein [Balneolaceae bacterium]|nr:cyclic nucleotide-binding domain-containing protein [Balneolaceae bacterium]